MVTDDHLRVLADAARGYPVSYPRPGWAEQDPRLWEAALGPAVAAALAGAGVAPEAVRALGVAGQLDGCVAVGADGGPLSPCLIWVDRRAEAEARALPAAALRGATGVTADGCHLAPKARWLLDHRPETRAAARFHQPTSYLVARLTGAQVYDHGLASTTMVYSLARRDHDPALLEAFGLRPEHLPAVAEATACAGTLHARGAALAGLLAGTPVAVGTGDDFSMPLGAGIVAPGRVACVLGTAEVVGAVDPVPRVDPSGLVETHAYVTGDYFVENPGWLAGGAVAWLVETLRLADVRELDRLAAAVPPGAEGLTFLPALGGAMAPEWVAAARGAFYGLTPAHGAGHLARAVLEGCAFAARDVITRLRELGLRADALTLLGGGARSGPWARIHADAVDLPAELPARTDTSAVGAAMLAAVAGGLQPDLATCAALVTDRLTLLDPDPAQRATYDEAHRRYLRLFESLRPMFAEPTPPPTPPPTPFPTPPRSPR